MKLESASQRADSGAFSSDLVVERTKCELLARVWATCHGCTIQWSTAMVLWSLLDIGETIGVKHGNGCILCPQNLGYNQRFLTKMKHW